MDNSFHQKLNEALRASKTHMQLQPWFGVSPSYFVNALGKIPFMSPATVWRGVAGVNVGSDFDKGTSVHTWFSVNSCTSEIFLSLKCLWATVALFFA